MGLCISFPFHCIHCLPCVTLQTLPLCPVVACCFCSIFDSGGFLYQSCSSDLTRSMKPEEALRLTALNDSAFRVLVLKVPFAIACFILLFDDALLSRHLWLKNS